MCFLTFLSFYLLYTQNGWLTAESSSLWFVANKNWQQGDKLGTRVPITVKFKRERNVWAWSKEWVVTWTIPWSNTDKLAPTKQMLSWVWVNSPPSYYSRGKGFRLWLLQTFQTLVLIPPVDDTWGPESYLDSLNKCCPVGATSHVWLLKSYVASGH